MKDTFSELVTELQIRYLAVQGCSPSAQVFHLFAGAGRVVPFVLGKGRACHAQQDACVWANRSTTPDLLLEGCGLLRSLRFPCANGVWHMLGGSTAVQH